MHSPTLSLSQYLIIDHVRAQMMLTKSRYIKSAKLINTNEPLICDITFFGEIFSHNFSHIYFHVV